MTVRNRENQIDCGIIKVDCYKSASNSNLGYNYIVPVNELASAMEFIKASFEYFEIPCARIYISGFNIVSSNFIWTKERIVEQLRNEKNKINTMINEKQLSR